MDETSAKIKELYTEGGPEADESTNIFFVSVMLSMFLVGMKLKVNVAILQSGEWCHWEQIGCKSEKQVGQLLIYQI